MPRPRLPLLEHTIYRMDGTDRPGGTGPDVQRSDAGPSNDGGPGAGRPEGEWVVLVHGAGVSSEIWEHQIEAYRAEFNLLLPDLRGHGASAGLEDPRGREPHTLEAVSRDVLDLLDHHGVDAAHFVGISMGTLVVRMLAELAPERVRSMVLVGAIARLKVRARVLIFLAHLLKRFVPHMWLYRFYAWILLPRRAHRASRRAVVRQAGQLTRATFLRWLPVSRDLPDLLARFEAHDPGSPTLYVMGDQDHMFLAGARAVAAKQPRATLQVIEACGHVCTVQRPAEFNRVSLEFLRSGHGRAGTTPEAPA